SPTSCPTATGSASATGSGPRAGTAGSPSKSSMCCTTPPTDPTRTDSMRSPPPMKPLRKLAVVALTALLFATATARYAAAYFTIDGVVAVQITANDRRTVGINTAANLPVNAQPSISFTNGSGAGQVSILYQGSLNLSGGTLNVDLNGVLTDSYGT